MLNREKSLSNDIRRSEPTQLLRTLSLSISTVRSDTPAQQILEPQGDYQPNGASCPPLLNAGHYPWARRHYLDACASQWSPEQFDLEIDEQQWGDSKTLTTDERHLVTRTLGFLHACKTLLMDQHALGVYRHINQPECRQYLLRQAFEDGLHQHAAQNALGTFPADEQVLPAQDETALRRLQWLEQELRPVSEAEPGTGGIPQGQHLLRALIASYVLCHGMFLHLANLQVWSLGRRDKMNGVAGLLCRIEHDEKRQIAFGIDLIKQIGSENPDLWTPGFKSELLQLVHEGVALETRSIYENLPRGMLGLNAPMLEEYLQFIANRYCTRVGLPSLYPEASNPFPWVDALLISHETRAETAASARAGGCDLDWSH